ncbi:MAG: spermidine synthase [Planctomycetota bacterium]
MTAPNSASGSRGFAWASALVVLLSAFLLFQVQPVISKMILPWFGGSPAVWTTCMLFFQVALLGGYAYAHWLNRFPEAARQAVIHIGLLALALMLLPIIPGESWKPSGSEHPTTRILSLLTICVGLPYFALASTGPLVQAWFSRVCPDRSPYWLYALSNIGSLGALLSYPFMIEPLLGTRAQGIIWSLGFGTFALASAGLVLYVRSSEQVQRIMLGGAAASSPKATTAPGEFDLPRIRDRLTWLALPALSTTVLLAITNHLCQDVAVVPFMWVAPLSLYLLSFIICFAGRSWYWQGFWAVATALGVISVCLLQLEYPLRVLTYDLGWNDALGTCETKILDALNFLSARKSMEKIGLAGLSPRDLNECIVTHVLAYLATLFSICMLCHGELVRRQPESRHLTSFYLMSSAGGAVGGIIVALVCPEIFPSYYELNWALTVSFLVALLILWVRTAQRYSRARTMVQYLLGSYSVLGLVLIASGIWVVGRAHGFVYKSNDVATARSFYGVLHVVEVKKKDRPQLNGFELLNGRILHGYQLTSPGLKRLPTTYYMKGSGPALAITTMRRVLSGRPAGLFRLGFDDLAPEDSPNSETPSIPDEPLFRRIRPAPGDAPLRYAVVGLGVGTMAAYAEAGDAVRFYEINPQVIDFAQRHFSFVTDCPGQLDIIRGDARLALEREEPQNLDLLVLDAFSGDAIPVHLLTDEALRIYQRHLKPTGVMVIHVSNRHLDLIPVVCRLARHQNLQVALISHSAVDEELDSTLDWMLVSANSAFMSDADIIDASRQLEEAQFQGPLWTDQYSNLFEILK